MMQTHKEERLEGDLRRGKNRSKKNPISGVAWLCVCTEREREREKKLQSGKKIAPKLNLCKAQSSTQFLIYKKST